MSMPPLDQDGYLCNLDDWSCTVAEQLAAKLAGLPKPSNCL